MVIFRRSTTFVIVADCYLEWFGEVKSFAARFVKLKVGKCVDLAACGSCDPHFSVIF